MHMLFRLLEGLPHKLSHGLLVQAARSEKLAALQALEAELKAMLAEIAQYADSDPKKLEAMRAPGPACCKIYTPRHCCMPKQDFLGHTGRHAASLPIHANSSYACCFRVRACAPAQARQPALPRQPPTAGWVSPALLLHWHAFWQHGAYPSIMVL